MQLNQYNKAIFAGVAGALVTVFVWVLELYGFKVPDNVRMAFVTLALTGIICVVVYIIPNGEDAVKFLLSYFMSPAKKEENPWDTDDQR